jgi:hypothetical protein
MSWVDGYEFGPDFQDLRDAPGLVAPLTDELRREVGPDHALFGKTWVIVARALPQDEVVVVAGDEVALVHLTWAGHAENAPWPQCDQLPSAAALDALTEFRY